MNREIDITDYDYPLPEERIAKFPLPRRDGSKLLVWRAGEISQRTFSELGDLLPEGSMLVFNNTRVIRARIIMHKPSGARIEIFCLEPHAPADYERAFAATDCCEWRCIVGNLKKWKEGALEIAFEYGGRTSHLRAVRGQTVGKEHVVRFEWDCPLSFGQLLEHLGRIPIPPYLNRDTEEIDYTRYQTVYSRVEGSVAAPTAGLHFTPELIGRLHERGVETEEVTLHVGAGTFLPVKEENAANHTMHTEHFEVSLSALENLRRGWGHIVAVGTTSVRTLESLAALGWRLHNGGELCPERPVGQWEPYDIDESYMGSQALEELADCLRRSGAESLKASTRIMITPLGFRFRMVGGIITNFHQPKSTLLLLVSAFVGEEWRRIYDYALSNGFRFLSYGDSSLLMPGGVQRTE